MCVDLASVKAFGLDGRGGTAQRTCCTGNHHHSTASRRTPPRVAWRERTGSNGRLDGAALAAVQAGRCNASVIGQGGKAGWSWPTVPRRLLLRFDWFVRSYVLVLTRLWNPQNSASVLGFAQCAKVAAASLLMKVTGPPRFGVRSAKQRRVASPRVARRRRAFARIVDPHAKRRSEVVIKQNRFHCCHDSFRIVRVVCNATSGNAK